MGGLAAEQLAYATKRDAVLAIGFTPYASETVRLAEAAAQRQVPVVAITDSPFSPLAQTAGVWLEAAEASFEVLRPLAAAMALAMTLALAVAEKRGQSEPRVRGT